MRTRLRFSIGLLSVLVLGLVSQPSGASPGATGNYAAVHALYGDHIAFDVYRNGDLVGEQTIDFKKADGGLAVHIDFHLKIKALTITFYKMTYTSDALWKDNQLVALSARTDRNGEITKVNADSEKGALVVTGPEGTASAPLGIFPTNHWNAGVIVSKQLVNTINGHVNDVQLVFKGVEQVETERGPVTATHYKYEGEIKNDVWYDAQGRWVHMQFLGGDGSLIEFRCRKCYPATPGSAS